MTRRQKISSVLLSYLQDISTGNGYLTNLGVKAYRWRTKITPKENELICILQDTVNEHTAGHKEILMIKVIVSCKAADNYTTLTNFIQDVHKAFSDNQAALGAAISQQVRWLPVSESIDIKLDTESEVGEAIIEMQLEHKFNEKWYLDETIY